MDDRLIDDVAREMTAAPSDGRLSERVGLALSERSESKWWIAVPLAAAAILILAVFVTREKPENVRLKPDTTVDATAALHDVTIAAAPAQALPPRVVVTRTPAPPDPIEIDPIAIPPLVETNAIQITPIAIDRIDIAPMP